MMRELDEIDKKLLNQLQVNNKLSSNELGKIVNLSTSAVQRRINRFRDEKLIEADVYILSPNLVGLGVSCVVFVTLEFGSSKVINRFKELLISCPEVMQCYYIAGVYDFVLIINTDSMKHYEDFSKKYFMDDSSVKQFYTHVVIDRVKVGFTVDI